MININLLPKHLIPKKRNFLPHIVMAVLAAVLLIWYGSSLAATFAEMHGKENELARLEGEISQLEDIVKQVRQLEQEKLLVSRKETAVQQIMAGRTVWSHELYVLAGLVPDGIWLDQAILDVRRRPVTIDVPNPNRKPGEPLTTKKTVIQSFPALRLNGFALSPQREKGLSLVGELIRNMKTDQVFATRFIEPEVRSIERQQYEDETVMKFVIDCEIAQ